MSAIYQRARPIRWEDVVGQAHVKDVLRVALEQGRIGHAYLFSGPRGVGKTTTARLIAMTANCVSEGPRPCGECESCLSVRAGSHPDVLEIDAASNNGVDDVRDLREKVSLAAMRGGKKIYILDEAHMMTKAAFNALLKTLEEPTAHVIFILATTEPEKIIPTILSRCQHYRFRRLSAEEIAGKLAGLARQEGVRADADALNLIGRLADGAMRDGESLLERMLAAGTAVTRASVENALGLPPGERVRGVAAALLQGDAASALGGAAQLYRDGFAARTVVEGLVAAFGAALHAELGLGEEGRLEGAAVPQLLKLQAALDEQESRFARSADQQSLELALTHALLAAGEAGGGASPARAPAAAPERSVPAQPAPAALPADVLHRLERVERELSEWRSAAPSPGPRPGGEQPGTPADAGSGARRGAVPLRAGDAPAPAGTGIAGPAAPTGHWADVVRQASMQLRAFLKPARMHAEAGYVSLTYDEKNAFHAKQVASKFDDVAQLVLKVFGPVTFELVAPEGSRRQTLGGGQGGGGQGSGDARPEPVLTRSAAPAEEEAPCRPAPRRAEEDAAPPPEIVPFEPVTRRVGSRPADTVPTPSPIRLPTRPAPAAVAPEGAAPDSVSPEGAHEDDPLPPVTPGLPPRPAARGAALGDTQARPVPASRAALGRVDPPSPDDVAPAPLPDRPAAPWDHGDVASAPPALRVAGADPRAVHRGGRDPGARLG